MRAFDSYIHIFYQLFENKTLLLPGRQGNGIHQQLVSTCCLICAHYETDEKSQWKTNGITILLPYCHLTLTRDMKDSLFDFASHWSWLSMWRVEITDPLSLFFFFCSSFFFLSVLKPDNKQIWQSRKARMSNEQCPPSVRQFYPAKLLECLCALQEDGNATLIRPELREDGSSQRKCKRPQERERNAC